MVGVGTFGKVFECVDQKYEDIVALKVVRKIQRYVESAKIEADILVDVCRRQKIDESDFCVKLYDHFEYDGEKKLFVPRLFEIKIPF